MSENEKTAKLEKETTAEVLMAVYATVLEMGSQGAPRGPLYVALMAKLGITMDSYERLEGFLIQSGFVERRGDVLVAKELPRARPRVVRT